MEFSELFHGRRSIFSPDGKLLACLCGDFVEIRYADTLLKAFKFECSEIVKSVKWSGDSHLVLCHSGQSAIKVFSVISGSCVGSLKQQNGSIGQISWVADCRTILYFEPLLFRAAVWKICDQNGQLGVEYINNVQPWAKPSLALSPNGKHVAVVICGIINDKDLLSNTANSADPAKQNVDDIGIFSAISWRTETSISCIGIQRVGGIVWSPNSKVLVVWPSDPSDPMLFISIQSGSIIGKWQCADKLWPGVCTVDFSPSAQFMTVVGRNSKVFMINCIAWSEELEIIHNSCVTDPNCAVFQEVLSDELENSQFVEVNERPVSISFLSSLGKAKTSSKIRWSSGGRYLASCLALAPAVLWIWSAAHSFKLYSVIVAKHPVRDFSWDPVHNILALVDGQDCVILWNADERKVSSSFVCTPVSKMLFQANHLNWRHDGRVIAVSSEENSTILELYPYSE